MSRRAQRERRAVGPRPVRRQRGNRAMLIASAIGITIVAIGVAWLVRRKPGAVLPTASIAPPDSIARLAPWQSYQRAISLGEQQHFTASLPYFRHALEVPPADWHPYEAYAITLFHATLEARRSRGRSVPSTRSTYERLGLMNEAARALDQAERLAGSASDQSIVIAAHAQQLAVWGFSWDALSQYARAEIGNPREHARAVALTARMRDPIAGANAPGDVP